MATPQQDDLQYILNAARTTPSGDNCQPWTFQVQGSYLYANYDDTRGRHALNAANIASYLSLGCLQEILHVAAAARGFVPLIERNDLSLVARFERGVGPNATLAAHLERRSVDRRHYLGGDFSSTAFEDIKRDCAESTSTRVGWSGPFSAEILKYLGLCEELAWSDANVTKDFLDWVRLSRQEIDTTRDGMPWRSLGINYMDSRILALIKKVPELRHLGLTRSAGLIAKHVLKQQLKSSAGILLFATRGRETQDVIDVGRIAMRAWLRLTAQDYALQPLTVMSMYPFLVHQQIPMLFPMKTKFVQAFKAAPDLLRPAFGLTMDVVPLWGFRVGKSTPVPLPMRTLRR